MRQPLHPDLSRWANLPDLEYRGSNEWSSSCPQCGGAGGHEKSDRFRMFAPSGGKNARGWCRRCGYFAWADEGAKIDPAKIAEAEIIRREYMLQEHERITQKIKALEQAAFWRGYHEAMTDQQRQLWRNAGIDNYLIDYYKLGYTLDKPYLHAGNEYHSPAMTIPHYGPSWHLTNVQYRLMTPEPGAGKYRMTAGIPAAMFITEPDEPLKGACLLMEGAKKAIVTYQNIGGKMVSIVAVPSSAPPAEMLVNIKDCDPVYICLDPDAFHAGQGLKPAVNRLARHVGRERARIVNLPVKADDLFVVHGGTAADFNQFIRHARAAA